MTTWDHTMETGYPTIDRQHREIIELVDSLESAESETDRTRASDLLVQVMDFTIAHFTMEEELMRAVHYPEDLTQEMLAQHREFTAYARLRVLEFSHGDSTSVLPLGSYLRVWLVDHEFGLDRRLVKWMKEQQPQKARDSVSLAAKPE